MEAIEGSLYRGTKCLAMAVVPLPGGEDEAFSSRLGRALCQLTRQLNLSLPLWMEKNTREFARFHLTCFFPEQFVEAVPFDRFQIRYFEEVE